jgi:hypothetical protein
VNSSGVQIDRIGVRRQLRCQLGLQFLQLRVGVGGSQVVEDAGGARQQLPRTLHRDDGVLERHGGSIARDRIDLLALLGHAGFDRRTEVGVLDPVEGRQLIRQRTRLHERIDPHGCGRHDGIGSGRRCGIHRIHRVLRAGSEQ